MTDAQLVLPFDEWEKWNEKPPLPTLPYFEKPATENERLLNLQYEYRHGSDLALQKLYKIGTKICLRFINAIGKKNKHVRFLSPSEKYDKAQNASAYILEQYLKSEYFYIAKNYPGYLYLRVLFELYYRREVDKIVDFVPLEDMELLADLNEPTWGIAGVTYKLTHRKKE